MNQAFNPLELWGLIAFAAVVLVGIAVMLYSAFIAHGLWQRTNETKNK